MKTMKSPNRERGSRQLPILLRITTWLVILQQLVLPSNYAIAAAQDRSALELLSQDPAPAVEHARPVVLTAMADTSRRSEIKATVSSGFSAEPTDEEFFAKSVFAEPLVPIGATTTPEENKA